MGSFNTTCMVSQQTIVPDTKVFIMPIKQSSSYNPVEINKKKEKFSVYGIANSNCYPTAFWNYAGPIMTGFYSDYGRFEIEDTPDNKINLVSFFDYLLKNAYDTQKGENPYHEKAFNMSNLYDSSKSYSFNELTVIWETMWEPAMQNRIFLNDYNNVPRNLNFAIVHHLAANHLIEVVSNSKNYNNESYDLKEYFKNYMINKLKNIDTIFKIKDSNSDENSMFTFIMIEISNLSGYRLGEQEGTHLSLYYEQWKSVAKIIENFKSKNKTNKNNEVVPSELIDELFEVFKSQIQHRYIHTGLNWFNIKLAPMVYGGQDYDNSSGRGYAKMIKEVTSKVNKEIKANS